MTSTTFSTSPVAFSSAWQVSGKWFRDESGEKVFLKGVTYGPFKPNSRGESWPEDAQLSADFAHIKRLGFNMVRIYEPPGEALLAVARTFELRLLVGIPWTQHVDFLADERLQQEALQRVQEVTRRFCDETCIVGFLVGNEIEKTLVRWMGPENVRRFLEKLIIAAKKEAPNKLVSYANYPSTEYLIPRNVDFVAFNVFLEKPQSFSAYLQRLQNLAKDKPLVITEFGFDTQHHGEAAQAEARDWENEAVTHAGVAGNFWFSYTDEWYRGGENVTGWDFGLVTRDRTPKRASYVLTDQRLPLPKQPARFSVIVCTRNGSSTLRSCLEALSRQNYTNYEVLVIDDGSTDTTPQIARDFDFVKYHRQDHAGLSVARNLGMKLASGSILAYTDDDCIPDEDWLLHLSFAYDDEQWVAAGGPNIPPPPRNDTEACVAAAPGAPAHVLINDHEAEHLPGCNLSIRKTSLEAIGGFLDEFKTAGDDVDVCWRLIAAGGKLRFMPAAVVWHHRRFTIKAYLRQQSGYGRAEAMLIEHHPERFAWFSGARWRGAIYGDDFASGNLDYKRIHFGKQGAADFQCIYTSGETSGWSWMSGLPWLVATVLAIVLGLLGLPVAMKNSIALPSAVSMVFIWSCLLVPSLMLYLGFRSALHRARQSTFTLSQPTFWHRILLWILCYIQPIVRDAARLKGILQLKAWPAGKTSWSTLLKPRLRFGKPFSVRPFDLWSEQNIGRNDLLNALKSEALKNKHLKFNDAGDWSSSDVQMKTLGVQCALSCVTEYHGGQRCLTRMRLLFYTSPLWLLLLFASLILFFSTSLQIFSIGLFIGILLSIFLAYTWAAICIFRVCGQSIQDVDLEPVTKNEIDLRKTLTNHEKIPLPNALASQSKIL